MRSVFLCVLLLGAPLLAQAEAPTLTEDQLLRLTNIELKAEVLQLRIAVLQSEFAKLQGEANTYVATLQKPGYRLEKVEGKWTYTPISSK